MDDVGTTIDLGLTLTSSFIRRLLLKEADIVTNTPTCSAHLGMRSITRSANKIGSNVMCDEGRSLRFEAANETTEKPK